MFEVKVQIHKFDRKIGAMVKALAVEVSGFQTVKGTTKEFLSKNGYYVFIFPTREKSDEFKESVKKYIAEYFVRL